MTAAIDKLSDAPEAGAETARPAPLGAGVTFGALPGAITFGALPEDSDAMCVWDGDAVVCTPSTNDKG